MERLVLHGRKDYYHNCSSYGNGIFHACRFMVHRIFESPPGVGVAFLKIGTVDFNFFLTVQPGLAVLVMDLNISTIIEIYVLYLPG